MKRRLTFFVTIMLIITLLAPLALSVPASAAYNSELDFEAEVVYMENLDQNYVIFNKNSTKRVPIASLTKIITCMVVLEECKDLEEEVAASASALAKLRGTNSSTAGTKAGEILTVRQLLNLMMVRSANEAALILAEHFGGGDISAFVAKMNEFAERLGCENTHFVNPHGLDAENHYSTAEDLAVIIKYCLQNDTFREIVAQPEYTIEATNKRKETRYINTNNLLNVNSSFYYEPCKGIKTGSTTQAGYCLASYATKNGYTYLCIIMNAPNRPLTEESKVSINFAFKESKMAYEWVFSNIKLKTIASTTDVVDVVDIALAKKTDHIRLVPANDVSALMPANIDSSQLEIKTVPGSVKADLKAPVKAGTVLGKAEIRYAGDVIETVDLVAGEDVERSLFATIKYGIKSFLTSKIMRFVYIGIAVIILLIILLRYYNKNIRKKKYKVIKGGHRPVRTTTGYRKKYSRSTKFDDKQNR